MAPGFEVDQETKFIVEAIKKFPGCNRCVVAYNSFLKLQAQIIAQGCWTTESFYTCEPKCVALNEQYVREYNKIVREKLCRMRDPGGCSGDGGITEGEIYNVLKAMNNEITRISTVPVLCQGGCATSLGQWYAGWKTVALEGCLEADGIDLTVEDPTLRTFTVKPQCNDECRPKIQRIIDDSFSVPSPCMTKGLQAEHLGSLTNAVNPKFCPQDVPVDESVFGDINVERAVIMGVVGFVGATLLVLLSVIVCNLIKGRRGWDVLRVRKAPVYKKVSLEDSMTLNNVDSNAI